ncbi:magnesium transporter [Thiothrix litoralis]|uniref:Magnesium transporter MgtE n=1 Tax=Thiothrix litoralis TaxID=2891210 RepID=A0ABX7WSN1_9GAMM|nr:magnesium transporter [Thiothrix litoralis]QTR46507.1 magnesium transporter [Thiothrix litoralis]
MTSSTPTRNHAEFDPIALVIDLHERNEPQGIRDFLQAQDEVEVAHLLESLPPRERRYIWEFIPATCQADVLEELDDGVRNNLLETLPEESVIHAIREMEVAEQVDLLESVSDRLAGVILKSLTEGERSAIQQRRQYPEESAGRYMDTEWIAIRADITLDVVARYLKRLDALPPHTDGLMVIDREGYYQGKLSLSSLLTGDGSKRVADVMQADADKVGVLDLSEDWVNLFEERETESIAVVDDDGKLVGRIAVDDALDIIRELADHQVMHMAGLNEDEDLFAPIIPSAKRRMFWLGINLLTAFLASSVIGLFAATLEKLVALAVLMPIVASMGGIAGSQTLTLAIRGLALGQISVANTRWLAIKEVVIAGINGVVWAMVVGLIAWLWFHDPKLAGVLAAAMIINQFAAAIAGLSVPLVLERMGIDPALSGSVILTTVTDVVGFMSFLGLATWLLL